MPEKKLQRLKNWIQESRHFSKEIESYQTFQLLLRNGEILTKIKEIILTN
jgi:hypothetical protein